MSLLLGFEAMPDTFDPVQVLRRTLQRSIRGFLVGPARPVNRTSTRRADRSDCEGLFGPQSVTWRVHSDAAILVGGLRSLLMQTMHPLAMAGVAEHSAYRSDPTGRLWRTAAYVGTITFGTRSEAMAMVNSVRRVHVPVRGTVDGVRYSANDPALLLWVHHTLVDSFLNSYQRFGGAPLSGADADRYVAEQAAVAQMFRSDQAATSTAELARYFRMMKPELRATAQAREAVRFLLMPPLSVAMRMPYALIAAAAVGSLPVGMRWDLRLPILPATDALAVRPAAKALTRVIDWALNAPEEALPVSSQPTAMQR